ncbi:MAG TPA: MarR family transcriptional regulator [Streptosporangiaceae bacterium]|nr:MarR family transcriptional regulator [Streptosporangiaceae bacterium]
MDGTATDGAGRAGTGMDEGAMDEDRAIRLRRVVGHLARQLNASSTGAGLTPSQASVLGLIVARGPLSLVELGKLEGLNPTMLSRVISRLAAMGLINRIPDPEDLRSASVVSLAAGQQVDQQIKARRAAAVSECMQLLGPDDVAVLTNALPALERLADAMRYQAAVGASS